MLLGHRTVAQNDQKLAKTRFKNSIQLIYTGALRSLTYLF